MRTIGYGRQIAVQAVKVSYIDIVISLVTFTSLFLPWWSIKANGVSIDIHPYGVRAWNVPTHDTDWVVDRFLALDNVLLIVGLLVVVSGVLALIGSLKRPPPDPSSCIESHSCFPLL